MNFKIDEIKEKINKAVNLLLKNDIFLLKNDAHERTIVHKFAEYLQIEFKDWHTDCEYNRYLDEPKKRNDETLFVPDIVIHLRDTIKNLLIIEVKKSNGEYNNEEERLKETTSPDFAYKYTAGLFVTFYVLDDYRQTPVMKWYKDGEGIE